MMTYNRKSGRSHPYSANRSFLPSPEASFIASQANRNPTPAGSETDHLQLSNGKLRLQIDPKLAALD